ncbi:MAG: hypothetical protein HY320_01870 [Armatimonadetes bacterium]|nr:hypothetical protein [Armatimonadota bacterium]
MSEAQVRIDALLVAHAVLHTCRHILSTSTDLEDARQQIEQLISLVRTKAEEERVPDQMLRDAGRDLLGELL